jgi:hypothetical protein
MSPHLACSVCTRSDHLTCIGGMVLRPCYNTVMGLRRRTWLQQVCLETISLELSVVTRTHIKQVPFPDLAIFVPTNDISFSVAEAATDTIRLIDMTRELVEHLARRHIHQSQGRVEGCYEYGLTVLRWNYGDDRIYGAVSGRRLGETKHIRPIKSERSSPLRRSYVRT